MYKSPFGNGRAFIFTDYLIKGQYIVVNQNILACVRGEVGLGKLLLYRKKGLPRTLYFS